MTDDAATFELVTVPTVVHIGSTADGKQVWVKPSAVVCVAGGDETCTVAALNGGESTFVEVACSAADVAAALNGGE